MSSSLIRTPRDGNLHIVRFRLISQLCIQSNFHTGLEYCENLSLSRQRLTPVFKFYSELNCILVS